MEHNLPITGEFSNEEIANGLRYIDKKASHPNPMPRYQIRPHPGFEIVELPDENLAKIGYGSIYTVETDDVEIELDHIAKYEPWLKSPSKKNKAKKLLKFHYKKAISLISNKYSAGWNRWSEHMLEAFVNEKLYKIVWGSGNCGKSITFALLLYIKWRVKPDKRMVVIATKVVKDAKARVYGYIKDIHLDAPESTAYRFDLHTTKDSEALYCCKFDKTKKKWVHDERACISPLPIKMNVKQAEYGSNLLGKHPDDRLIVCFDECQELYARLLEEKIFANWLTNTNLDVHAWGNPIPVDYHAPEEWDMLFSMGAKHLSLKSLKRKEKEADRTTVWQWHDTFVLHLSMLDSPKDDPEERNYFVEREDGSKDLRLFFLGGRENAKMIAEKAPPGSSAWYSQVLGFPFIDDQTTRTPGVLAPIMVKQANKYPLHWKDPNRLQWFMGVDPSQSDRGDKASIIIGRMGMMVDGRHGIDIMDGQYCRHVQGEMGEEFIDSTIELMYSLSKELYIPLGHIAIEAHSSGEVLRYALMKHIEDGKWEKEAEQGQMFHVVSPVTTVTDRPLFRTLGSMEPAKNIVTDCNTEYWIAVRCFFMTRQIFNVPEFVLKQFYNRHLLTNPSGTKFKLESKRDMKEKRRVRSPNDADALCNMIELMRHRGLTFSYKGKYGYHPMYGPDYYEKQEQAKIDGMLGRVSKMLALGQNLATFNGYEDQDRSISSDMWICNIDSV